MSTIKFGLTLKKGVGPPMPSTSESRQKLAVSSVFNQDDSDDEAKDETVAEKFDKKYAGGIKPKDQRLIDKIMAEDPSVYEYDEKYDEIERQKNEKVLEQKLADKEKKPKYAHNIINAAKKRELSKLLHDEHVYKKERAAEAGVFEDKEVYVTGAYRQQIEERNKFREEVERQDAVDDQLNVKDQKVWQLAFNRRMLDERTRTGVPLVKTEAEGAEVKTEVGNLEHTGSTTMDVVDEKHGDEIERLKNEEVVEKNEELRHPERWREKSSERSSRPERSTAKRPRDEKRAQKLEEELRMEKIRAILKRRNDEEAIAEMRKRFFERLAQGVVVPPTPTVPQLAT